jgi:hypothetical protein
MSYEILKKGTATLSKSLGGEESSVEVALTNDITVSSYTAGTSNIQISNNYSENELSLAQSFSESSTFKVTDVSLNVVKSSSDYDDREFTISICEDSTGVPGDALTTKTFTLASLAETAGNVVFGMDDDEITLSGETTLWLKIDLPGMPTGEGFVVKGDTAAATSMYKKDGDGEWTEVTTTRFHYSIVDFTEDTTIAFSTETETDQLLTDDVTADWTAFTFNSGVNTELTNLTLKSGGAVLTEGTTGNVVIELYSDNTGAPNASIAVLDTIAVADFPADEANISITGLTQELTASTDYWIVIKAPITQAGDSINVKKGVSTDSISTSSDGGANWTPVATTSLVFAIVANLETIVSTYSTGSSDYAAAGSVEERSKSYAFLVNSGDARNITGLTLVSAGKTGSPTGNMTVEIKAEAAGEPTGAALASETFALTGWPATGEDIEIEFDSEADVTVDTDYFIILTTNALDGATLSLKKGKTTDSIISLLEGGAWSETATTSFNNVVSGKVQMDSTDDNLYITQTSATAKDIKQEYSLYVEQENGSFYIKAKNGLPENVTVGYIIVSETE